MSDPVLVFLAVCGAVAIGFLAASLYVYRSRHPLRAERRVTVTRHDFRAWEAELTEAEG